ncbi:hypothetical protein [Nocardia sp. NPDC047038]|uniref:hypothetical protein n=1 Tax=Nocardia sp. NPDC047038 TaxID=3154338 RepID=UPI0033C2C9C5
MENAVQVLNPLEPDPRLRYEYGRGSGYETELRLTEALSALVPADKLVHTDHRLFQVTHLITEFAWAGIHHTLCDFVVALAEENFIDGVRLLKRATSVAAVPALCVRLLLESLPQASFLRMRDSFPSGASGLDSPGTRAIRKASRVVWDTFESTVITNGHTISSLMPATELAYSGDIRVSLLAEMALELHRFDSRMLEWKQIHLNLVWQFLGGHPGVDSTGPTPTSLRGRPLDDLSRLAVRPAFPRLWQESTALYQSFGNGAKHGY